MIGTNKRLPYLQIDVNKQEVRYLGYILPLTEGEYAVLKAVFYSDEFADKDKIKNIIDFDNSIDKKISLSSIPVHVFSINRKAILAGGRKIIENEKNKGYFINKNL